MPALRDYFLKVTPPMPLLAADGGVGRAYRRSRIPGMSDTAGRRASITTGSRRGRKVFARNCIVCHSSIQPSSVRGSGQGARRSTARSCGITIRAGGSSDPEYLEWAEAAVEKPSSGRTTTSRPTIAFRSIWCRRTPAARWRRTRSPATCGRTSRRTTTGTCRRSARSVLQSVSSARRWRGSFLFTATHAVRGGAPRRRRPGLLSRADTRLDLGNGAVPAQQQPRNYQQRSDRRGPARAFDDAITNSCGRSCGVTSSSYNGATPERLHKDHGLIWRTTEERISRSGPPTSREILGRARRR